MKYVPKGNGDPEQKAELDLAEKERLRKRSKELESDLFRVEEFFFFLRESIAFIHLIE